MIKKSILGSNEFWVLDIGSRGNLLPIFRPIAENTNVIGFEPDRNECNRLNQVFSYKKIWKSVKVLPIAVGYEKKNREFFVAQAPVLSSLLKPNHDLVRRDNWKVIRVDKVDTVSLDILNKNGDIPKNVDFIKLDTQGSELEIIKSGEQKIIDNLLGLEVETEFCELYIGQPRFSEIEQYLRIKNFDCYLVLTQNNRDYSPYGQKRTAYCDALFLRNKTWLKNNISVEKRHDALVKLTTIYLLYGLYSEALHLTEDFDSPLYQSVQNRYTEIEEINRHPSIRWRFSLIKGAALCALSPTRERRIRFARFVRNIFSPDGAHWNLDDLP
jgi:FkbM family methyltransferase